MKSSAGETRCNYYKRARSLPLNGGPERCRSSRTGPVPIRPPDLPLRKPRGCSGDETPGNPQPRTLDAHRGGPSWYHPQPVRPPPGARPRRGPARTRPGGGVPGRSCLPTSTQPRADRAESQPLHPPSPSHLPYRSIPLPRRDSREPERETARGRTQGAEGAARVFAVVLRHGRSAHAGDRGGRGRAPLAAPRPLLPSLAWRRAGSLAKAGGRGRWPRKGKSARAWLTPPPPLSQREARSPRSCRAGQRQQPHGRRTAARGPGPGAYNSQHATCMRRFRAASGTRALGRWPEGVVARACGAHRDEASGLKPSRGADSRSFCSSSNREWSSPSA